MAIYLNTNYNYKSINIYENYPTWEGQFIEVTEISENKSILIGNIYRPLPNTAVVCQTFINDFIPILANLQRNNREVKVYDNVVFCDYFNSIMAQSFIPKITLPTRLSSVNLYSDRQLSVQAI